jgi:hypothetical protein
VFQKAPGQYTAYSGTITLANNLQILIGHIITKLVSNASVQTEVHIKSIRLRPQNANKKRNYTTYTEKSPLILFFGLFIRYGFFLLHFCNV